MSNLKPCQHAFFTCYLKTRWSTFHLLHIHDFVTSWWSFGKYWFTGLCKCQNISLHTRNPVGSDLIRKVQVLSGHAAGGGCDVGRCVVVSHCGCNTPCLRGWWQAPAQVPSCKCSHCPLLHWVFVFLLSVAWTLSASDVRAAVFSPRL